MRYPYIHIAHHDVDFDPQGATEAHRRDVLMRHYDYLKWAKTHTTGPYFVDNQYNAEGITVGFANEYDYERFLVFCDEYWIFLHD